MFVDITQSLLEGRSEYPAAFRAAKPFWDKFFGENDGASAADLRAALDETQMPFQWAMEKEAGLVPPFAKSIMVLTAVGSLYDDGFEDSELAERVLKAFAESTTLSLDVKARAPSVAQLFGLSI